MIWLHFLSLSNFSSLKQRFWTLGKWEREEKGGRGKWKSERESQKRRYVFTFPPLSLTRRISPSPWSSLDSCARMISITLPFEPWTTEFERESLPQIEPGHLFRTPRNLIIDSLSSLSRLLMSDRNPLFPQSCYSSHCPRDQGFPHFHPALFRFDTLSSSFIWYNIWVTAMESSNLWIDSLLLSSSDYSGCRSLPLITLSVNYGGFPIHPSKKHKLWIPFFTLTAFERFKIKVVPILFSEKRRSVKE